MKKLILVAVITGVVLCLLAAGNVFSTWNLKLTDVLYGDKPALENIVIVSIDDQSLQEIGRWPWDRSVYAGLLRQTAKAKVVAFDVAFFEPTQDDEALGNAMREAGNVIIPKEYDFIRKQELSPVKGLENIETGMVNVYTDKDGITRSVPVKLNEQASLAYKVAEKYVGGEPTVENNVLMVNYAGGPGTYTYYPAADVINGRVGVESFENKIVLIGATAPDLHDDYLVPTSNGRRMPGVEIHGHAIQTILTKQFLHKQGLASLIIIILLFAGITGALFATLRMRYVYPLLIALLIAYLIVGIMVFKRGTILNLVYPPITIIITALSTNGYLAFSEREHKKQILGIFGRYVSKDIVTHLLTSEKAIELGGEEREITAMFADIRGFTAMSEKMTPHEVISMLNHYFGDMTDLVFKHDGTLDKFIGDCLFALWGSPLEDKDHALKAVKCCLDIQKRLKEKHNKDIPPISLGIGICSGPAIVGNMGSKQRQEFTAIGDTVNTASRLSGQAGGGEIKISETTYNLVKDKVNVKKLEPVKVKGKEKPLNVYLVEGLKN